MKISRRSALSGSIAALASFGVNPLRAQSSQAVVGTWGGDYAELLRTMIDDPILKPQGIEALQDVANADPRKTKLIAERQNRRGAMDIACLSDTDMYIIAQQGILEDVPAEKMRNGSSILPILRKPYSIPHIYSFRVILYNPNRVPTPPKSYADLWDPKWRGRVGLSDILYMANTESAALAGGGSVNDYEPAKKKLLEWRSLDVKIYPSNEALASALKSEEVWLTIMWMARGVMWQKSGIPLQHVVPSEGATPTVFEAAVPKNARNKENAWRYLDAMLDPKSQIGFAERMGFAPTVTSAKLPPELEARVTLSEADRAKLLKPDYGYLMRSQPEVLDFWNKQFKA